MIDWQKHWALFPGSIPETDYLRQVGKTVNKKPISSADISLIISQILNLMKVNSDDDILDLCCGNGFITYEIAKNCKTITGIDYSSTLIAVANKYKNAHNISYINDNVLNVEYIYSGKKISKIYMYEALQHFTKDEFNALLTALAVIANDDVVILLASVPDKQKKWLYYNSIRRKLDYIKKIITNKEAIGTWWDYNVIDEICKCNGFTSVKINQNPALYTSHYRFDVLITRQV